MPQRTLRTLSALTAAGLVLPETSPCEETVDEKARWLAKVADRYPVALSPLMAKQIAPGNPADPIGRQFLPQKDELENDIDELEDPIADQNYTVTPGLIHRYPDRVLLLPTLQCAVYCRFCFRRTRVGRPASGSVDAEMSQALDYIRNHTEIFEVILTGGDPLMLSTHKLCALLQALDGIPHVRILRIHSRIPVVAPERITSDVLAFLEKMETPLYLAIHANHPNEFTESSKDVLKKLARCGVSLLGQSVLLRGVNDSIEILSDLMKSFLANRIRPYYLHHLDPAPGTRHFRVPLAHGQALIQGLRGRISGLGQPDYVLDIPGGHGKSPLDPGWFSSLEAESHPSKKDAAQEQGLRDWKGKIHRLPKSLFPDPA